MRKIALVAALFGLAAAPVAAETAVRDAAPVESESELSGAGGILAAMGVAVVVATIILVTDDDDDIDLSVSA
mgnify:CR=1 FL=1